MNTHPILLGVCVIVSSLIASCLWGGSSASYAGEGLAVLHRADASGWSMNVTHPDTNDFINRFHDALESDGLNGTAFVPPCFPFIIRSEKLLCRRVHRDKMRANIRIEAVADMIRAVLHTYPRESLAHQVKGGFPLLLFDGDKNGCEISKRQEDFNFPRLSWSYPSSKHGSGWCNAIPVPTYTSWKTFHKAHKNHSSWDSTFASQSEQYPWSSKINKAVWRGSTTYDRRFYGMGLDETPRGQLVQTSMEHPDLIDAGFVKLNQQYSSQKNELVNQTIIADHMRFDHQMKYKAIFDIDGNNWSSRFPKLLCTNSVIIKIDPDYIEYFYHELTPMVHYVPASLDNLTEVAAYVLDNENADEMKLIVDSANLWCKRKMTEKIMVTDFMMQLKKYEVAFNGYMEQNIHNDPLAPLLDNITDLVECK